MRKLFVILLTVFLTISFIPTIQIHFVVNIILSIILFAIMLGSIKKCDTVYLRWCTFFLLFCLCSVAWAIDKRLSLYVIAVNYLPVIITMLSVTMYGQSLKDVQVLMKVFYIANLLMFVFFVCSVDLSDLEGARLLSYSSGDEVIWNPNYVAGNLVFTIYAGFFCFIRAKGVGALIKFLYWILSSFMFLIILLSGSRASLLLFLMPICVYFFFSKRISFKTIFFLLLGGCVLLYLVFNVPILYSNIGIRIEETFNILSGDTDGSEDTSRILMIVSGLAWFAERPILGYGINNFRAMSNQLFKLDHNFYAHNNFVELLVGVGLVGFLLYYIPIFRLFFYKNQLKINKIIKVFLFSILFIDMFWVSYYNVATQYILCILFILNKIIKNSSYEESRHNSPW